MKRFAVCAVFLISILVSISFASAATYYISPSGSDSSGDGSSSNPWRTTTHAFTRGGGHTYIFKDGIYDYSGGNIINPPSGTSSQYTLIMAENDGAAIIDGQNSRNTISLVGTPSYQPEYIRIEGFHARDSSDSTVNVMGWSDTSRANHIEFRRVSGKDSGTSEGSVAGFGIYTEDNLIEDSWFWGHARTILMNYGQYGLGGGRDTVPDGEHTVRNTVRRVVLRFDSTSAADGQNVYTNYGADDSIVENVIALDANNAPNPYGAFRNRVYGADDNKFLGVIALDVGNFHPFSIGSDNIEIKDCVAMDSSRNNYFNIEWVTSNIVIDKCTAVGSTNNVFVTNTLTFTTTNSLFKDCGGATGNSHNHWDNCGSTAGSNPTSGNSGLLYLPRVESGSAVSGTGQNGVDRGANIVNRYVDGVLTSTPLWPWPYQDRIKQEMCINEGETRGFCSAQSLTHYVWEYLGNPCPSNICNGTSPPPPPPPPPPPGSFCGDSTCDANETCSNCVVDCGACPSICGNSIVETNETCDDGVNNGVCPASCSISCTLNNCTSPPPNFCGDSTCDANETCSNCAVDCGTCTPPPPPPSTTGPGDINNDSIVNIMDILIVVQDIGKTNGFDPRGDIDNNNMINIFDLTTIARNWGNNYQTNPPPPPTPGVDCSQTNTLCVDDDSGANQEFATIQAASNVVNAGDTVVVFPGTYAGFQVTDSGTSSNEIIFKAEDSGVQITSDGPTGDGIRLQNVDYVTIEGFEISGSSQRCIAARGATPTSPMTSLTIKNNSCTGSNNGGFYLSQVSNSLVENNFITDVSGSHGIYLANAGSDNNIIRGNTVINGPTAGIHFNGDLSVGGDGIISGITLEGNTIIGSGENGFNMDGVQDSLIVNNLVYGIGRHALRDYAIDAAEGPKNLRIVNNILLGGNGWPIKLTADQGGHTIFNNILFSSNGAIVVDTTNFVSDYNIVSDGFSLNGESSTVSLSSWQSSGHGLNSQISSSLSVFVGGNDYHSKDGSPSINNGAASFNNINAPNNDFDGVSRPISAYDIGAYER